MKFFIDKTKGDILVLPVFEETENLEGFKDVLDFVKDKEIFTGKEGEIYEDLSLKGNNLVLVGLGKEKDLDFEALRKSYFKLGRSLNKNKIKSAKVVMPIVNELCYKNTIKAVVEGLLETSYKYDKFLSEDKLKLSLEEIYFDSPEEKLERAELGIKEAQDLMSGIFLTRDLVNEPAMYMTPSKLAKAAKEELEPLGVDVEVFEKEKIENLGMEAFLAVSKGSDQAPKFIVMKYEGNPDSEETLGLVGKGLTYDSGGYCIKSANGMLTMHCDMAGAGSVIGTMKAIAKAKLETNVVAVIAACENMISGKAYKTGDIIGSMGGKTIEVINTDAEGRLTLADAIYYIATQTKATKIVDIATLTGACVGALANIHTGAITNNKDFMEEVNKASQEADELVWELPNHEEYRKLIKSHRADLRNSGRIGGGTITAGQFLEAFVEDKPWVHLDIAGTAYFDSERGYLPKDATGIPVKTLFYLAKNL